MNKPKNYYCHRSYPQQQPIPKQYELIQKIGEGAFGEVFKVFNTQTSSIQVMKRNKPGDHSENLIHKQEEIMSQMQNSDGFAKVKDSSSGSGCLVMTLLGQSLDDVLNRTSLNIIDIKRIAYQCIIRLKELHDRGYVHRDIKPQNILLGNQMNPHKIYLVDFGLATTYKKTATTARKIYAGELGTIKYCSLAAHYGLQQFPKDDLQSLGYLLVYLSRKDLPWHYTTKGLTERQKYDEIKRKKQETSVEKFSEGVGCFKKYFRTIKQLKIGSCIDYQNLLQIFKIDCKDIYCYSFCKNSCFCKLKQIQLKEEQINSASSEHSSPTIKISNISISKR